jgi:putative ABC transport system permease protein
MGTELNALRERLQVKAAVGTRHWPKLESAALLGWRLLTNEKGRNALATGGIFIAVLMIFLQLGFYFCAPKGGMLIYDNLRFDLMMTSSAYVFQGQSAEFPRRRLYQALSMPEVESVSPFYQGEAQWLNQAQGRRRDVFVMGFKLADGIFSAQDIERQLAVLQRPDVVLVDSLTLPMYGPKTAGRLIEIGDRTVEIGGQYQLGTGFVGLGAVVVSDVNFIRIFPNRSLGAVNLGLLKLKPGSNPAAVAARIQALLPADTQIFTRPEIEAREVEYWERRTSTGLIFGFGVIVSIIVGVVILYQTLATQVTRQLPQYATLKAMGYTDAYLRGVIVMLAMITATIAFAAALAAAMVLYSKIRTMARLPIEMTLTRVITVLAMSLIMAAGSALGAARRLRLADPADLF